MAAKIPVFLGPCVLESQDLAMDVATSIKEQLNHLAADIDLHFKGSFDKANRTSIDSYRGPGMDAGLKILEVVKNKTGLKTITDFHLPEQAEAVASVVDVLQIPAFLCRQTDMLVAGAKAAQKYGKTLKMKKGQFLSPYECKNMVEKAAHFLPLDKILLTERGSCFGYQNLIVDMTSFTQMKSFGVRVIFDATHSAQKPGALGNATGGQRNMIPFMARAAIAAGADGLFMECHPDPTKAKSDAATQVPLASVGKLVTELVQLKKTISQFSQYQW